MDYICALRGWSLTELGERSGHEPSALAKLARRTERVGGSPGTLDNVAEAAGVNVEWLTYGRGPIEGKGMLKEHPDWKGVLEEAKKKQRGIPDEFWELAGATVFPTPRHLDWQLVVGMVRELYKAHQRFLEERDRQDERSAPHPSDEARGDVITHANWGGARRPKKSSESA